MAVTDGGNGGGGAPAGQNATTFAPGDVRLLGPSDVTLRPGKIGAVGAKWLIGYVGTWFVLATLSENASTRPLADTLAITIAFSTSILFLPGLRKALKI